jgi:iron(III) transport system permease protein
MVRTTLTVTLPLIAPGILSGAIIVFVTSAGEFGVPFKLSAPYGWETLTTQIFSKAVGDDANHYLGAAMSMALGAITALFIYIQQRYIAPRSFTTVTGKGYRPSVLDLGRYRWVAFGYNITFILIAVVLPILCLALVSLHPVWQGRIIPSAMTFDNYERTLFFWRPDSIKAATNGISNSFILAFAGASIAMVLSLVVKPHDPPHQGLRRATARLSLCRADWLSWHRARHGRVGDLHQDPDLRHALDHPHRLHHPLLSLWATQRVGRDARNLRGA